MVKVLEGSFESQGEGEFSSDLDALAHEGARRMLAVALEAEVAEYVSRHREAKDEQGRARVVSIDSNFTSAFPAPMTLQFIA